MHTRSKEDCGFCNRLAVLTPRRQNEISATCDIVGDKQKPQIISEWSKTAPWTARIKQQWPATYSRIWEGGSCHPTSFLNQPEWSSIRAFGDPGTEFPHDVRLHLVVDPNLPFNDGVDKDASEVNVLTSKKTHFHLELKGELSFKVEIKRRFYFCLKSSKEKGSPFRRSPEQYWSSMNAWKAQVAHRKKK